MEMRDFPETSWTLLAKTREQCDEADRAKEEFANRYYKPVNDFLLVLVQDPERAQELAQEFFTRLSGPGGLLDRANREKGTFRNYLRQALRNLAIDYHRRKRKEGVQMQPDEGSDGGWDILDLPQLPSAEAAFHRAWVKVTLADALTRVRALCLKRNQEIHLQLFESRYLGDAELAPGWNELGARYGMDQKTARERADTVIRHFRFILRRMLRNEIVVTGDSGRTQVTDAAIDEEIKSLLSPL
jgi:RNA polymerase sigma factor (sigma-70 family)